MFTNLFGISGNTTGADYRTAIDATLLPLNPLEPGRFNVIRDFKMSVAPGWKSDTYRKVMLLQRKFNSHGKIYFGPDVPGLVYPSATGVDGTTLWVLYPQGTVLPTITLGSTTV